MDKSIIRCVDQVSDKDISNILKSVLTIETYYRPYWFRAIEYCYLFISCIRNTITKHPVKNITISKFQLGVLNILRYHGAIFGNNHLAKINSFTLKEFYLVINSCTNQRITEIASWYIKDLLGERDFCNVSTMTRFIGYSYNGSYKYATVLEKLVMESHSIAIKSIS